MMKITNSNLHMAFFYIWWTKPQGLGGWGAWKNRLRLGKGRSGNLLRSLFWVLILRFLRQWFLWLLGKVILNALTLSCLLYELTFCHCDFLWSSSLTFRVHINLSNTSSIKLEMNCILQTNKKYLWLQCKDFCLT